MPIHALPTVAAAAIASTVLLAGCADSQRKPSTTRPALGAAMRPAGPVTAASILEKVKPSLVVVEYTFDGETGRRELRGQGIIVREDGLIAVAAGIFPPQMPDAQMINFKVIVPPGVEGVDEVEYNAKFLGRDERVELAYVKVDRVGKTWPALPAPTVAPLGIGQKLWSVGLLDEDSGYTAYVRATHVGAQLRGPVPLVLTDATLTSVGSPVFDEAGRFVAIVPQQEGQTPLLNPQSRGNDVADLLGSPLTLPPHFVVGTGFYTVSLNDPPTAPDSRKMNWLGIAQMNGLAKEVAEAFGLKGKPLIQIGDVVPGGPADQAGLKNGTVITAVDGKELERGDVPDELPLILARQLARRDVGDQVVLTVKTAPDAAPQDVTVTLGERPAQSNTAARFYAEDLGFTVRDLVFNDRYARHVEANFPGVVTTFVKPQGNAQAGGLRGNDVITKLNQIDIKDVAQFKEAYEGFRKASPKEAVVLEVLRGADTQIIRVQPPQ